MVAPPTGPKFIVRAELFDNGPTEDLADGPVVGAEFLDFEDSQPIVAR